MERNKKQSYALPKWMGRLKSAINSSATIVYNNFLWPSISETNVDIISWCANNIIEVRNKYNSSSLADLYEPLFMPVNLLKAHQKLNKAVEQAHSRKNFSTDTER